VPDVSATDAARNLADLLDAIEHRGEHFTIVRRGKAIARLSPMNCGLGVDVKALFRRHRPDAASANQLDEVRSLLEIDERNVTWLRGRTGLDVTFVGIRRSCHP
jgi:antitoxin (DNA-binding transcriptional repressor) of toxin-antitoxin stability system